MSRMAKYTDTLRCIDTYNVFYDMTNDQADTELIDTVTDAGTVVMGDGPCGIATFLPGDGTVTDNDEAYLATPNETFLFAQNCYLYGRCRLKFTETAAGVYNAGFFFMNAVGANSIIDDGGGLKVSGSTVGIYKTDGSSVWKCVSANNGTSTVSTSSAGAVGATWYILEIFCEEQSPTAITFVFAVDGVKLLDSSTGLPIRHTVTFASATEMQMAVGAKLGAITNNDPLLVDYMYGSQLRV
jgi:hypothetical protein